MLDSTALQDVKPLFLVPCAGGMVFDNCVVSLLALLNGIWAKGFRADIRVFNGSSLIPRTRNESIVSFLSNTEHTHLFWIDADISFSPEAAFRLLMSDHDVVASPYPRKSLAPDLPPATQSWSDADKLAARTVFPVNGTLPDGTQLSLKPDKDGFLEVAEAPTGFMCIKRSVFTKMMAAYPELRYVPDDQPKPELQGYYYRFFDTMIEPETNRYLSEDYAFCRRWRDIGGRIFVDATAKINHMGQMLYRGDFAETLRLNPFHAVGGTGEADDRSRER